ncbi:MAG: DUF4198 domain-containing protein [Phycisphaerae bacterium]|nr:DUF4198 domain-containing protein [Phycisphaerae bacterium]
MSVRQHHSPARRWVACAAVLMSAFLSGSAARGHDSFLVADRYDARIGELRKLAFITVERYPESVAAVAVERIAEWVALHAGQRRPIAPYAPMGHELVARTRFEAPGLHVLAVALKPQPIEMTAAEFEEYLKSEHAVAALNDFAASKPKPEKVREIYTKFAKTFVAVEHSGPGFDQPVGHLLELVPLSDPMSWRAGQTVAVRLLFRGQPLPGLYSSSGYDGLPEHAFAETVLSDEKGEAKFQLLRPGRWFMRAQHIERVHGKPDHEWESWWATLTIRVGEPDLRPTPVPASAQATDRPAPASTQPAAAAPSPPTEDPDDPATILKRVAAAHDRVGPWAVAGYRMTRRALRELGRDATPERLRAVHESPADAPYSCVADGIRAALGPARAAPAVRQTTAPPDRMRTRFTDETSKKSCVIRLRREFVREMLGVPEAGLEEAGRRVAAMRDEEIMQIEATVAGPERPSPGRPPR